MATGKNTVIVYIDLIHVIEKLTDEQAGQYMKHFLRYVNDLNPVPPSNLIDLVFEPQKQQLKRDLIEWEKTRLSRSKSGSLGGLKSGEVRKQNQANEASASNIKQNQANEAVIDIVTVTVTDTVIDKFNFKKSLLDIGISEKIASEWLKVRKTKKLTNSETAFNRIKSEIDKSGFTANQCIETAVIKSWGGFEADWMANCKSIVQQQSLLSGEIYRWKWHVGHPDEHRTSKEEYEKAVASRTIHDYPIHLIYPKPQP